MKTQKLMFKVVGADMLPVNGGHMKTPYRLGRWTRRITKPLICRRGYHLTLVEAVLDWTKPGCRIFVAEGRGEGLRRDDKSVHESVRLLVEVTGTVLDAIHRIDHGDRSSRIVQALPGGYRAPIAAAILKEWARRNRYQISTARRK